MTNNALKTAMPQSWRIGAFLAALVGGVIGALAVKQVLPEQRFDLVLCLIGGSIAAGVAGGFIVVLWFIYRAFCPASAEEDIERDDTE